VAALNAMGNAWSKFNAPLLDDGRKKENPGGNKLRTVILQRIENQTIHEGPEAHVTDVEIEEPEDIKDDPDDF